MKLLGVMVLVLAFSLPARAEDKAVARDAYRKATQAYNLGEYTEALDGFKTAYRNFEDPTFLFNIGQCHRMLGSNQEALRSFRAYLRETHDPSNRAEVERLIVSLEALVKEQAVSRSTPPQGTVPPAAETVATVPSPAPVAVIATPPPEQPRAPEKTPAYKKWWVWTLVVVAAAGVGVGLGVGLTRAPSDKFPHSSAATDGTFHF